MTRLAMADLGADYARIFGRRDDLDAAPGERQRKCKVCGGWHRLSAWPHNCMSERPPRAKLAAPSIAPRFEEFVAGTHDDPVIINDRRDKRNYMERHDLVEYDTGVKPPPEPTEREWMEDFVQDFKRAEQTDPLNRPPTEVIGRTDLEGANEIDVSKIEVAK